MKREFAEGHVVGFGRMQVMSRKTACRNGFACGALQAYAETFHSPSKVPHCVREPVMPL
jgi:hypothetical protein